MHPSIHILLTKGSNFCLSFLGGIIDFSLFKNPPPLDSAEESAADSRWEVNKPTWKGDVLSDATLKGNCDGLEGARKGGTVDGALESDDGINPVAWWEIERKITPETRIILVLVIIISGSGMENVGLWSLRLMDWCDGLMGADDAMDLTNKFVGI